MKYPIHFLASFALATLSAHGAEQGPAKPEFPPHTVSGSEIRVLPRTRPDRQYQLHIGLPAGFREHPEKKYPVVFVTDGYWDFTTVAATYGNLVYGKNVPEMIVVGLGYAGENPDYQNLRDDDLSPVIRLDLNHPSGHAKQFLELIETSVIPLLEKEYRADPQHRYLMGCSLGGAFTLYAALTKPELFQGYVADSPAVSTVLGHERSFAAAGRTIPGRVFISEAENEWPSFRAMISMFYRQLEKDAVVKGGLKFRQAENLRHAGGKPETYTQGLLFVTAPIAPETGPQPDNVSDPDGRPAVGVVFWPKQPASGGKAEVQQALRLHQTWLEQNTKDKRIAGGATTPAEANEASSSFVLFTKDPAEAEALAKSSPAVQSGVLSYDVMPIEK